MSDDDEATAREAERDATEAAICSVQSDLSSAEADLAALQGQLEQAAALREQLEQRVDALRDALRQLSELMRAFREESNQRIATVSTHREVLESRLANARSALEAYWATTPHARHCDGWLSWKPPAQTPITPADLSKRFDLPVASMAGIITHAIHGDSRLRERLLGHQREWREARGPTEKAAAIRNLQSVFAGEAGERIVRAALTPIAERVSSSVRKDLAGGSFTKVDGTYEGLTVPLILGRGDGMAAPAGGSCANEVKWGRAEYIWSQRNHMATQAEGHQHYDTSVTLCSRNFHDLSQDQQTTLRDTLHAAHSPLLVILPRKEDLDQACIDVMMNFTVPEVDVP